MTRDRRVALCASPEKPQTLKSRSALVCRFMPTLPSDAEYANYFRRLWAKLAQHLFRLGGEHVLGAVLAIAGLGVQYHYGLIPAEHGWKEIKSIGWPYAALVGMLVLLSFLRTVVALDSESQRKIRELSGRLEFPDKALAEHLREPLRRVGDNGKKVIQFILWHGETLKTKIKIPGMSEKEIYESVDLCVSENLVCCRSEAPITSGFARRYPAPIVLLTTYCFVPDELKDTLMRLIASEANAD
jgi:hypothetical protein